MGYIGDRNKPPVPARTWILLGVGAFLLQVALRWGFSALGWIHRQDAVALFAFPALFSLLTVGALASMDRWLKKP